MSVVSAVEYLTVDDLLVREQVVIHVSAVKEQPFLQGALYRHGNEIAGTGDTSTVVSTINALVGLYAPNLPANPQHLDIATDIDETVTAWVRAGNTLTLGHLGSLVKVHAAPGIDHVRTLYDGLQRLGARLGTATGPYQE